MTDEIQPNLQDNVQYIFDKKNQNYIRYLENLIKERDEQIFILNEKLEDISNELKSYDKLMGYTDEMSIRDKRKHNLKCDKEERKIRDIVKELDPSLQAEYESDLQIEEDIVDLALEQNQLQFEISEAFHSIKESLKIDERNNFYEQYKQYKRDLYRIMDGLYNIVLEEFKPRLFEIIEDIVNKQGSVYEIDEKIKKF